jgi:hypothetical protein
MARGHARFPASVRELHAGNSALGFDEPKNQREVSRSVRLSKVPDLPD